MEPGILYRQLCEILRSGIVGGAYPPGSRLPTEPELMAQYKVSRGTVRRALDMLKEEGLLVSMAAKGTFVTKPDVAPDGERGSLIVVLTPDIDTGYFSRIIRGIERQAYADGFVVRAHATNDLVAEEERYLAAIDDPVAGVIVAAAAIGARSPRLIENFGPGATPLVFVDRYLPGYGVDVATSDNVRGGLIATEHLLAAGHQRIGIALPRECSSFRDRLVGYRLALEQAGIAFDPQLVARPPAEARDGSNSEYRRLGELMIQQMLALTLPPSAFIVPNNMAAVGALGYLRTAAPRIHEAMAIVGWDSVDSAEYVTPALTTIDQEPQDMGAAAARLLISRINHVVAPPRHYALPVSLCVRDSTATRPSPEPTGSWAPSAADEAEAVVRCIPRAPRQRLPAGVGTDGPLAPSGSARTAEKPD